MNTKLKNPGSVFRHFEDILKVPRPSKHEALMTRFLVDFAKNQSLSYKTDDSGNVIIYKPATKGMEKAPCTILQAHMDMVCDKAPGVEHDFMKDPIRATIKDGWMMAEGTTLGADNGIGVAAALAVLSEEGLQHGPLECLFTVDEETGLTGAFQLQEGVLSGKYLLNLDSEDEGEIFIGCAGGMDTVGEMSYEVVPVPQGWYHCTLTVTGLKGGHSGDDINKKRGNANQILFRLLKAIDEKEGLLLTGIDGGNLRNAIAHTAVASLAVPESAKHDIRLLVNLLGSEIAEELAVSDPGLEVILTSTQAKEEAMSREDFLRLTDLIFAMPHGVMAMSQDVEGLVETSTNLASIKNKERGVITISTSQRSSLESQKIFTARRVEAVMRMAGLRVSHSDGYPGWKPNPGSRILMTACQSYELLFGKQPKVKAIHAGLECGLFLSKYPHLDMISFGPTLRDVHTPKERMEVSTVELWWTHLVDILERIGKETA